MSPFFRSTVEPISTSFVSFFRIEVVSFGTTELPPAEARDAEETCDPELLPATPDGTAVFPPHAEVARSAPAVSRSTRLLKVGILNLAPNAVMKQTSKCLLRRLQERATGVHIARGSDTEKKLKSLFSAQSYFIILT